MVFTETYLAQTGFTGANPVTLYSGHQSGTIIKIVNICNTTSSTQKYSVYHPSAGNTYSTSNAVMYNQDILSYQSVHIPTYIIVASGANVGVQCNSQTGLALTFSFYGATL